MSITRRWPSLADQVAVANRLYGRDGERMVADWVDRQLGLVGDMDFASQFATHIRLPGVSPIDYAHRRLHCSHGDLVGGIRFYNRNVARPFVDVLAHTFTDIRILTAHVRDEWSPFSMRYLRLRGHPGSLAGAGVILDQSVHVARYGQMSPADGRVRLESLIDPDEAIAIVAARYRQLAQHHPRLAANLSEADAGDIRDWHDSRQLHAIRADGVTVGVLAVAPGCIGWIVGDEINEEVIALSHNGHGYAASAQAAWSARLAARHPDGLLIGTIDRLNHASRATALRAGRPAVLDDVFVRLD